MAICSHSLGRSHPSPSSAGLGTWDSGLGGRRGEPPWLQEWPCRGELSRALMGGGPVGRRGVSWMPEMALIQAQSHDEARPGPGISGAGKNPDCKVCVCAWVHTCTCVHACACTCSQVCMHVCAYVYSYAFVWTCCSRRLPPCRPRPSCTQHQAPGRGVSRLFPALSAAARSSLQAEASRSLGFWS